MVAVALLATLMGCSGAESGDARSNGPRGARGDVGLESDAGRLGDASRAPDIGEDGGQGDANRTDDADVDARGSCEDGHQGCPCYGNGTCNGELACQQGLCTQPADDAGDGGGDPGEPVPVRPEALFLSTPAVRTTESTARFQFGCTTGPCTYLCALDLAPPQPCEASAVYDGLTDGLHVLHLRARDAQGLESDPSEFLWVVAPQASSAGFRATPGAISTERDATFEFQCDQPGSVATCALDTGPALACTSPLVLSDLADGRHTLAVACTDPAGNPAPAFRHTWYIDATGPSLAILARPPSLTNNPLVEWDFACSEPPCAFECELDGVPIENCLPPVQLLGLVRQETDAEAFTADQGALDQGFWQLTAAGAVRVPFRAPLTGRYRIGVQAFSEPLGGEDAEMGVGIDGQLRQSVAVLARRGAPRLYEVELNVSEGRREVSLSLANPASNPAAPQERRALSIGHVTIEGPLDVPPPVDPHAPRPVEMPDGERLFVVRAIDVLGNLGEAAVVQWTQDTQAPGVVFDAVPAPYVAQRTASLAFRCSEASCTYVCSLNGAPFESCTSPFARSGLAEGPQTFEVMATDRAGNRSATLAHRWTVDATPPTVTFGQTPAAVTNDTSATFTWQCDEDSCAFECALDLGAWQSCASPWTLGALGNGQHTLGVRATDLAGQQGPEASYTWRVGVSSGENRVQITQAPLTPSFHATGQFTFACTEPPCSFECRITRAGQGAAAFGPCPSPYSFDLRQQQPSKYGDYTLEVRALDVFGDASPVASHAWTIAPPRWIQVTSSRDTTCGLLEDQTMWCWGTNVKGQYGRGDIVDSRVPVAVAPTQRWLQISSGYDHNCALREDQTIWCAGWNSVGQLGDGTDVDRVALKQVGQDSSWADVSAGGFHTCALRQDGTLWCWGLNTSQQTGFPSNDPLSMIRQATQVGAETDWVDVAAGGNYNCALKSDKSLWCWGDNRTGQLGMGSLTTVKTPTPSRIGTAQDTWEGVASGPTTSCAIKSDRSLWCWGANGSGQCGTGSTQPEYVTGPTRVGNRSDWATLDNGGSHSCGITLSGTLYCWGSNTLGQLGVGTRTSELVPVLVTSDVDATWAQIDLGNDHSCGILSDGSAWCWGDNNKGQLGDGTVTYRVRPTAVAWPY